MKREFVHEECQACGCEDFVKYNQTEGECIYCGHCQRLNPKPPKESES